MDTRAVSSLSRYKTAAPIPLLPLTADRGPGVGSCHLYIYCIWPAAQLQPTNCDVDLVLVSPARINGRLNTNVITALTSVGAVWNRAIWNQTILSRYNEPAT